MKCMREDIGGGSECWGVGGNVNFTYLGATIPDDERVDLGEWRL